MGFSIPFFKKKSDQSIYFGLYITDASAFGFVFEVKNGVSTIIAHNIYSLTAGFDKILEDVDNLISELELKTNHHLSQTIFFLHSWMIDPETYEIKAPYKDIIKKLSKDLELEPLGYIDVKEALERYFKDQSIVNTVAIEVNKTKLGVTVIKGNKIIHSQYIARTDEVGDDLSSVFKELPKHITLPNMMKVFGDEDKAEIASKLATYEWDEKIFPEHPTIEVIKQDDLNKTLVETFTKEMLVIGDHQDQQNKANFSQISNGSESEIDTFGFVEGKDVLESPKPSQVMNLPQGNSAQVLNSVQMGNMVDEEQKGSILAKIKGLFMPGEPGNTAGSSKKKVVLISLITVFIIVGILAFYEYFLHTLHIKVYLKTKTTDQIFDLDIPIKDTDSNELAVIQKNVTSKYSNKKNTSGVRDVGETATGTVIIHNFDNTVRTFTKGTEISKGSLVFLLDSDVKVASASGATSGSKESGKKSVTVTAKDIGSQYNLASGSQLKIASLPDSLYFAIADGSFSGGSKKEVSTVSKKDMEVLKSEAEKQAEKNSENVLGEKISSDEILISDLTSVAITDTNYSGEVGEEAKTLGITADSEVEYFTLKKKALLDTLQTLFSKELDAGYTVDPENIEYTIENVDQSKGTVLVSVDASATVHKDVALDTIKSSSRMHLMGSLDKQLKKDFEIEKIETEQPLGWIPVLSSWTPIFSKNISISTSVR